MRAIRRENLVRPFSHQRHWRDQLCAIRLPRERLRPFGDDLVGSSFVFSAFLRAGREQAQPRVLFNLRLLRQRGNREQTESEENDQRDDTRAHFRPPLLLGEGLSVTRQWSIRKFFDGRRASAALSRDMR
jgi:hypothetical protein